MLAISTHLILALWLRISGLSVVPDYGNLNLAFPIKLYVYTTLLLKAGYIVPLFLHKQRSRKVAAY
jgi:cytochrome c oxidase subunit IV